MKKKGTLLLFFLALVGICFLVRAGMEKNFGMMLESELGDACTFIIAEAVEHALRENPDLTSLVTTQKNDAGMISYVSVDDALLNRIAVDALRILEHDTEGLKNIEIRVPIGNLFFSQMFSGRGFCLTAQAYPASGIDVRFAGALREAGINQVQFHVDMIVAADMEALFGFRHYSAKIERSVPLCDIIIVGSVPESYTDLADFLNLLP